MIEIRQAMFMNLIAAPNYQVLFDEYATESGMPGLPAPRADVLGYLTLEQSGALTVLCAFKDETIIGVAFVLVSILPHYSVPAAHLESFFVASEHRRTGAARRLMAAAEDVAVKRGAAGLFASAAIGSRMESMMSMSDYRPSHQVFFKALP